ncbi:hypothetical protein NKH57_02130 [Mesorhizobium sp. M1050]|uniref:hypothetical protein n=1 Tax=Mesorhizobium sp. M1050 TaxID=2957051 RepID=UPI00333B1CC1
MKILKIEDYEISGYRGITDEEHVTAIRATRFEAELELVEMLLTIPKARRIVAEREVQSLPATLCKPHTRTNSAGKRVIAGFGRFTVMEIWADGEPSEFAVFGPGGAFIPPVSGNQDEASAIAFKAHNVAIAMSDALPTSGLIS